LQFLNATLKNDENARTYIENRPEKNGFPESLISKTMKKPEETEFDYKDFNDLSLNQDYRDLIPLYKKTLAIHPNLKLEEGMLNTLGLRLSFDPKRTEQGINVFLLAIHIYPESANLYDSLAEAYLHKKEFKNAIVNFKKSLELNPENQNAIDRLKQLEE
jgi:tetratricopeptide (TPR) repeat protein